MGVRAWKLSGKNFAIWKIHSGIFDICQNEGLTSWEKKWGKRKHKNWHFFVIQRGQPLSWKKNNCFSGFLFVENEILVLWSGNCFFFLSCLFFQNKTKHFKKYFFFLKNKSVPCKATFIMNAFEKKNRYNCLFWQWWICFKCHWWSWPGSKKFEMKKYYLFIYFFFHSFWKI